jgi:hypothetical protein
MSLNYLRYRLELRKQRRHAKDLQKKEPEDCEQNQENGALIEYFHRVENAEQWLALIQTAYFIREAERLLVPVPEYRDEAMFSRVEYDDHPDEPYYLTPLGIKALKALVREEKKHRRDIVVFCMSSLTGLIGATIGLITIISKI